MRQIVSVCAASIRSSGSGSQAGGTSTVNSAVPRLVSPSCARPLRVSTHTMAHTLTPNIQAGMLIWVPGWDTAPALRCLAGGPGPALVPPLCNR